MQAGLFEQPEIPGGSYAEIDGPYRYRLERPVRKLELARRPRVLWVMLNPSYADQDLDDPTMKQVRGFTEEWELGPVCVVNLFALISTDPCGLLTHPDPIGPKNDERIEMLARAAELVVCAWGNGGPAFRLVEERTARVLELLRPNALRVIGLTQHGRPRHPLRQRRDGVKPQLWTPEGAR